MSKAPKLLIIGAGGHGRSVAEAALLSSQYQVIGFLDDGINLPSLVLNLPVFGGTQKMNLFLSKADKIIVAIGNNKLRESLAHEATCAGYQLVTVIHPRAIISPTAVIGQGCAVMAGAIVGSQAQLGLGVIMNCGAVVDHNAQVADFGHLGVNVCMAGGSKLGRGAWLQAGCAIGYGAEVPALTVLRTGSAI